MASTTGRGAGWISPSSGRRARSTGAHGRERSQASAGLSRSSAAGAVWVHEAGLDRHPSAHAVARDVRALDAECVHRGECGAREPGRVVRRADRLVRLAESGQVDRDDAIAVGQRGDGGQEGGLRAAEPVEADDRLGPGARGEHGDLPESARAHHVELEPPRLLGAARGREEAHAHVQAASNLQASGAERVHAAAHVGGDLPPGGGVGAEHGVRFGAVARVTQAQAPPGDHRIARAPAGHDQPDARPSAGHVHHVRVEALGERRDSVGRRRVASACGRRHPPINTTETVP